MLRVRNYTTMLRKWMKRTMYRNYVHGSLRRNFLMSLPDSFNDFADDPGEQCIDFMCAGDDAEKSAQKEQPVKL